MSDHGWKHDIILGVTMTNVRDALAQAGVVNATEVTALFDQSMRLAFRFAQSHAVRFAADRLAVIQQAMVNEDPNARPVGHVDRLREFADAIDRGEASL
jgi:hypothetical protein